MKYKDRYTAAQGIFYYMKTLQPNLYTALFSETDSAPLDAYAYMQASLRTLTPLMEDENYNDYLNGVFVNYGEAWQKAYTAITAQYDVLHPNDTTITKTGTDNNENTGTQADTESEKAFNSTDFVESGKNDISTSGSSKREYNETQTTSKGIDGAQSAIVSEMLMRRRFQFLKTVAEQIIYEITLSVYE